ncbi:MAG TPA: ABC transporter permease [Planctomycetota bacterium]|nr:ABC transporter permease [Planctomycetota bacterium]
MANEQAVMLPQPLPVSTEPEIVPSRAPSAWSRLWKDSRSMVALGLLLFMLLCAISANWLAPYPYDQQFRAHVRQGPSAAHVLGTDFLGRDMLSRVMYGARVSLLIGISATVLSLLIGVTLGLSSGYFGGATDAVLMRLTDTIASFPTLLLAIAITVLYKPTPLANPGALITNPSFWTLFIALGMVGWTGIARVVRAQVLTVKTLDYVTAARALGGSNTRIMFRHILPNCLSPIIVLATLAIGGNILGEAGLSFLGLGIQEPFPSWGGMLSDSQQYFELNWWMAVFPGMAIVLTVLSFNLLGDGLRDALDPKARK